MGSAPVCRNTGHIVLTAASGYLASQTSAEFGYGTAECPWRIQAGPGQRVRLTLVSFSGSRTSSEDTDDDDGGQAAAAAAAAGIPDVCYEIGTALSGGGQSRTLTACGSGDRRSQNVLYTSEGNNLTVRFHPREVLKGLSSFLIRYEGMQRHREQI